MDWERAGGRRLTRRRLFATAGMGAAAAALAACGGGSGSGGTSVPGTGTTGGGSPSGTRIATTTPTPTRTVAPRAGETLRYAGFVSSGTSFDPHKTQVGPVIGQQALVFSRLITYANQREAVLAPDLATDLPEQPDQLTYIFHVHPDARWHDVAPLNGRSVTAEDVLFSIERQRSGDTSFVRKARWSEIDTIEIPEPGTLKVAMKAPLATMLPIFADATSYIVAPELSPEGRDLTVDQQIGSGPFRWVEWSEGRFASVARNTTWHRWTQNQPALAGVDLLQPSNTEEIEALFRVKRLDSAFLGRPQAERLKQSVQSLQETTVGHGQFYGMWFFIQQAPFNDVRFRSAVTFALDRRAMIERFFAGSGEMNPWVSWPMEQWTLPQTELVTMPGYREGEEGRAADIAEAQALLAAFTAEKGAPGEVPLFVVDEAEAALGLGSLIRDQLASSLGLSVAVYPMAKDEIVRRMIEGKGEAAWAAAPDTGPIDLDDWLFPMFHSAGSRNTAALRDPDVDAGIAAQRVEFDIPTRREIGFAVQRRLATLNVAVNFVSERVVALAWPYVRAFPLDTTDGYQDRFAHAWIDRNDETFRGRP